MISITIAGNEFYDGAKGEFVMYEPTVIEFEHSLVSLSKWESKFGKPFLLDGDEKTEEEIKGYFEAMVVSGNFTPDIFQRMTQQNYMDLNEYIKSTQSATTFFDTGPRRGLKEVITSEVIYFWMVTANIPPAYEVWHLNRLFNLIRIYGIKNSKDKKMAPRDAAAQQRAMNEQRKKELGTTG